MISKEILNKMINENQFKCPCCGLDLNKYVSKAINQFIEKQREERRNARLNASESVKKDKDISRHAGNPDVLSASKSRTEETFRKQSESLKKTYEIRTMKFAELISHAIQSGENITPEKESEFLAIASKYAKIISKEKANERARERYRIKKSSQSGNNIA